MEKYMILDSPINWDDAFNNSNYVPEATSLIEKWVEEARSYRARLSRENRAVLDIPYGKHPRERLDVFHPKGPPLGTVIFVHGGYWHSRSKDDWSGLANGLIENGWTVVIPSYPLAPENRLTDITKSISQAVLWVIEQRSGAIRLVGHSAGGHLVSRMACLDTDLAGNEDRIGRVVSISGVHDLRPLLATKLNAILRITTDEALAEGPVHHHPFAHLPITFWVGAQERPEFLRQNRMAAETWEPRNTHITSVYDTGHNHFSVIDALSDPASALVHEILR